MNNEKFKEIKCCLGTRFTTGYVCATGKQKESGDGKIHPVKNTNLYDVIENYINNTDYRKQCEDKAKNIMKKIVIRQITKNTESRNFMLNHYILFRTSDILNMIQLKLMAYQQKH